MGKTPATAAERKRNQREKMKKDGTYQTYLNKQKDIMARKRKQEKQMLNKLNKIDKTEHLLQRKKKETERKALYRMKKRLENKHKNNEHAEHTPSKDAYKNSSTKGKAMARVKRNLPSSPRKRRAVVKELAWEQIKIKPFSSAKKKSPVTSCKKEDKNSVTEFYSRDDISRQAPGKCDVVKVKTDDGSKIEKQKRHLLLSVMEAYQIWKSENPSRKIGKSIFASLRPKHVLLTSQLPRNVCVCKYHDNFINLANALHKVKPDIPKYDESFTKHIVCDIPTDECWFSKCSSCMNGKLFKQRYPILNDKNISYDSDSSSEASVSSGDAKTVKWYQWQNVTVNDKESLEKTMIRGSLMQLYSSFIEMISSFLPHHYIKRCQANFFNEQKEQLEYDSSMAMLQIDFAENYSTIWQDEIQSAHWQKKQITIFTSVYWNGFEHKSSAIVSDDLGHNKDSIVTFLDQLISDLVYENVKDLHIWSDGPSHQFKNKFIANTLPWLSKRHSVNIEWHFFATSHGKGCVDGVGGTIKRQVAQKVIQRKAIVKDAASFYNCTKENTGSINTYFIDSNKINTFVSENLRPLFDKAPEMKGIFSSHHFFISDGKTFMKSYSNALNTINSKNISTVRPTKVTLTNLAENKDIRVNDCVKVVCGAYKGFYAIVNSKSYGNEWEIQYFKKTFDKYVLKEGDIDSREPEELIKVEPTVDNRGRYIFSE